MIHAEEIVTAAIAHLRADLPARIEAMNLAKADDLVLATPADDGGDVGTGEVSYSTGADPILRSPWVEVALPDFTMDDIDVGQMTGRLQASVFVRGFVMEARPPLARADLACKRFGNVLLDSLMQPGAFGGHSVVIGVRGAYRIDPEIDERDGPLAAVHLAFTVEEEAVRSV